jgi:hypothetical protein
MVSVGRRWGSHSRASNQATAPATPTDYGQHPGNSPSIVLIVDEGIDRSHRDGRIMVLQGESCSRRSCAVGGEGRKMVGKERLIFCRSGWNQAWRGSSRK